MALAQLPDLYRRDQRDGISPPDLTKSCTYAEHVVHARGKRTRFTSVSESLASICDMGEASYRLLREKTVADGHRIVEHVILRQELEATVRNGSGADRTRAVTALRYARRRQEALVEWTFDISGMERKLVLAWAGGRVREYFTRLK